MGDVIKWHRHKLERHEHCDNLGHCPICDGGLSYCTVCGGAEGSLPEDCPGERMTHQQSEDVYNGVIDYRVKLGGWTTWTREKERRVKYGDFS